MFAFQIKLPNIINGTLSSIGLFIGPNAMLVAGMLIAAIPLKSIVSSKRIYLVTLLRLLVIPLLLLVLIKLVGFVHWLEKGEIIVLISFLATTSPSASTVTQMAVIYNNNPQKSQRHLWDNDAALYVYYATGDCLISNVGVNRRKVRSII